MPANIVLTYPCTLRRPEKAYLNHSATRPSGSNKEGNFVSKTPQKPPRPTSQLATPKRQSNITQVNIPSVADLLQVPKSFKMSEPVPDIIYSKLKLPIFDIEEDLDICISNLGVHTST
jgi:hypothetical protein